MFHILNCGVEIREVTGSNPVEVLTFSGFYTQLLKIVFITAMIIAHLLTMIMGKILSYVGSDIYKANDNN